MPIAIFLQPLYHIPQRGGQRNGHREQQHDRIFELAEKESGCVPPFGRRFFLLATKIQTPFGFAAVKPHFCGFERFEPLICRLLSKVIFHRARGFFSGVKYTTRSLESVKNYGVKETLRFPFRARAILPARASAQWLCSRDCRRSCANRRASGGRDRVAWGWVVRGVVALARFRA